MPRKKESILKSILGTVALFVGFAILILLLWVIAFLFISSIIFAGLTAFTDWGFGDRIGWSLLSALIVLKVLSWISDILELLPQSWLDDWINKKTSPDQEVVAQQRSPLSDDTFGFQEHSD